MKHLRKINNYNSYLALLSALDSAPIRRFVFFVIILHIIKIYVYNYMKRYKYCLKILWIAIIFCKFDFRLEWHKTITEGLKEYCALIDSSSSFRAYRQALAETNPPCIPYMWALLVVDKILMLKIEVTVVSSWNIRNYYRIIFMRKLYNPFQFDESAFFYVYK